MQLVLPFDPAGSQPINAVVSVLRHEGQVAYFAAGVPLFIHREGDLAGQRVALLQLMELGLAHQSELSASFGMNRTTLFRQQRKLKAEGVVGVVDRKRGPQGPHRFTTEKREKATDLLSAGWSIRKTASAVGVTEGIVRHALKAGELQSRSADASSGNGPAVRSLRAARASGGVAVERHQDRALARVGQLREAAPRFSAAEGVRYGGVLLALPALLSQGLLDAAVTAYHEMRSGFYGLRATLLTLAFMALLRIRTPEALQGHPPGELGIVLGLDRAPEVKTLRRKIWELARRQRASVFSGDLAKRWVADNEAQIGLLYIDGHVRAYHGSAHQLPKGYSTRRRLCMPATTDFWVNQQDAQPLLVVTAPANDDLIAMLRSRILPEVRTLVGPRRVTLVFDREGYSPKFFRELDEQNFDVITYRRGVYAAWPEADFRPVTESIDGRAVTYILAERDVVAGDGFAMREIRRRCASGHQTAILTTRRDLPAGVAAYRMFERWTQENFFRYMRQHFALDALTTYDAEPADPGRIVVNPHWKELSRARAKVRTELRRLEQRYGERAVDQAEGRRPPRRRGKSETPHKELLARVAELRTESAALKAQLESIPRRIPLHEVMDPAAIVRLEPETKHLTDAVKMVAFRAETALTRLLVGRYGRTEDEGRALVREILQSNADILPDLTSESLLVRFHTLSNPRSNAALAHLCETLNNLNTRYPGTNLRIQFQPLDVA